MKHAFSVLVLISSGFLINGCGSDSSSINSGSSIDIAIPFRVVANNETIRCGETIYGLGLGNTDIKLADARLFIHDILFVTDQNIEIPINLDAGLASQQTNIALLDFRDKIETEEGTTEVCAENNTPNSADNPHYNDTIHGFVTVDPAYTISHIKFTLGVPFQKNHANQSDAIEPLRNPGLATGMHWNWQNGYKFANFDVRPIGGVTRPLDATWSSPKWNLHIGSTGCAIGVSDLNSGTQPEACLAPNRTIVTLPLTSINWDEIAIEFDYSALVAMSNLAEDNGQAPGCMSGGTDPECEHIFEKLGLPWGANEAEDQSVFSIVALSEMLHANHAE